MSKISDLKANINYNFNIIDLLKVFAPDGKTKYIELLLKLTNTIVGNDDNRRALVDTTSESYGIDPDLFKDLTNHQVFYLRAILKFCYVNGDIRNFKKFCEFNEKGLIKKNDISQYSSFEEINVELHESEEREKQKQLESQILKLYENDEWLVMKPLTYESSLRYGSNTKWCTSSKDTCSHFDSYSKKGILIYTMNKQTNLKVAAFKSLSDYELTFWNQIDKRIDSSETGLPFSIIELIRDEMINNPRVNSSFMTQVVEKYTAKTPMFGRTSNSLDLASFRPVETREISNPIRHPRPTFDEMMMNSLINPSVNRASIDEQYRQESFDVLPRNKRKRLK